MYAYKPIDTVFLHNIIYIIILLFDTKNYKKKLWYVPFSQPGQEREPAEWPQCSCQLHLYQTAPESHDQHLLECLHL